PAANTPRPSGFGRVQRTPSSLGVGPDACSLSSSSALMRTSERFISVSFFRGDQGGRRSTRRLHGRQAAQDPAPARPAGGAGHGTAPLIAGAVITGRGSAARRGVRRAG